MSSTLGRLAPMALRRAVGRARGEVVRAKVLADLQRIARSDRPILAGPWLGEVGFEILYWVPFLRWVRDAFGISPRRVTAISRGGPASWYRDVASRYVDVFDLVSLDQFRDGNEQRRLEIGEQKQLRLTSFDETLVAAARAGHQADEAEVLHPALMYRLLRPYWWRHAPAAWVSRHARYAPFSTPEPLAVHGLRPGGYVAVKFYSNDCLAPAAETRIWVNRLVHLLAEREPVVSLSSDLIIDDHRDAAPLASSIVTLNGRVTPRDNLDVQTAVVAHARAFVGTYGGFSYLAPLCGVPTHAVYGDGGAFDASHLHLAQRVFRGLGAPVFELLDLHRMTPEAVAAAIGGPR